MQGVVLARVKGFLLAACLVGVDPIVKMVF